MCEGLSGSTSSATTLYQRALLRISPDLSRNGTSVGLELQMSGNGVISNDADRFKRFYSYCFGVHEHTLPMARESRLSGCVLPLVCVTPTSSGRFRFIDSVLPTKHLFGHDRP